MEYKYIPVKITPAQARTLLTNGSSCSYSLFNCYQPMGLYYLLDKDRFVGIDNRTGDAWTEDFDTIQDCLRWLNRAGCPRRDQLNERT